MARTNRLVDRLCQVYQFEEAGWNISINQYRAALLSVLAGTETEQNIVNYWQMSAGEEADWDLLVARIVAHPATVDRLVAILVSGAMLNLYEEGLVPAYDTPNEVWAKMMTI